jgi:DNA-binding PadR family transcriptional regulator
MSVKNALLALLYQRPMHGYELGKQLKLTVHAEWDVKPGQIASTLARLKDAELVDYEVEATDDAPDRKVYFITDEGQEELRQWYLTPEVRDYRLGDTFYIKLVLSLISSCSTAPLCTWKQICVGLKCVKLVYRISSVMIRPFQYPRHEDALDVRQSKKNHHSHLAIEQSIKTV